MGRGILFQLFEWRLPSEFQSSFYNEPANLHLFYPSRPSICKLLLVTHSVELPKQRFFLNRGPYSNNTPSMLEYFRE